MSWRFAWLVVPAALAACGAHNHGADACELGPKLWQQDVQALVASQPPCASDSDCVQLDTNIACKGVSISLCGTIMHRAAAAQWDAGALCQEIDSESAPTSTSCSTEASCVAARPACVNELCTGVP